MAQHAIDVSDYRQLGETIGGGIVLPDDADYDEARAVWNAMIDKRPAVIVRAATVADVAPALAFARRHGLLIAIRGGGHNVAGHGTVDGGLVLDLAACNDVHVDPDTRIVTAGPGATLADLDAATAPHGLAVPVGVISATGIAGLALGGGFGWLTRAHGLTADNLVAAEVVTVDGRTVRASATENPDLLWALKGGGGNFGVVTSFSFSAHPLPTSVLCGNLVYSAANWTRALRAYARWTEDVPDEMTSIVTSLTPPPDWELGAEPVVVVGFAWAGSEHQAGQDCLNRLLAAAPPDVPDVARLPWPQWQSSLDAVFPRGVRAYWRNTGLNRLDGDAIDVITRFASQQTWLGTAFDIHHMGGAFGRVDEHSSSFPSRNARYWINIYGFWNDAADDAHHVDFIRSLDTAMRPFSSGAQYLNFMGAEADNPLVPGAPANQPSVYGEAQLARLRDVKLAYDPANLLRLNHNIPPTLAGA